MKRDVRVDPDTLPGDPTLGLDEIDQEIAEVIFQERCRGTDITFIPGTYHYRAGVDPLKDARRPR